MSPLILEKKIAGISPQYQEELASFVEYLLFKQRTNATHSQPTSPKKMCFGALKESIPYIAPDFDEPLECFREYM